MAEQQPVEAPKKKEPPLVAKIVAGFIFVMLALFVLTCVIGIFIPDAKSKHDTDAIAESLVVGWVYTDVVMQAVGKETESPIRVIKAESSPVMRSAKVAAMLNIFFAPGSDIMRDILQLLDVEKHPAVHTDWQSDPDTVEEVRAKLHQQLVNVEEAEKRVADMIGQQGRRSR